MLCGKRNLRMITSSVKLACWRWTFPINSWTSRRLSISSSAISSGSGVKNHQNNVDGVGLSSVLFLSPSNWPEPNATAAGIRTMSLLQHFSSSPTSPFTSVHFGSGAKNFPQSLNNIIVANNIHWHKIKPNRTDDMTKLLETITANYGPVRAVIFDRFYSEEAFSFRIRSICPDAMLILDMQDVHSLRAMRQCVVEEYEGTSANTTMTKELMQTVMELDPASSNGDSGGVSKQKMVQKMKAYDTFLRELSSVHRSDLVLVCSSVEMRLLESWGIPNWKLVHASFFCMDEENIDANDVHDENNIIHTPTQQQSVCATFFDERNDFVTVGGFKHAPNVDSIKILHREIWPRIRLRLPNARLHIYGAYPSRQILSMHDERSGFLVHGRVDNLGKVLLQSRVLLAPLRFGAGCKGKIIDAWRYECPVVTTPVGSEGMTEDGLDPSGDMSHNRWGGLVAHDTEEFVSAAVQLYTQEDLWQSCKEKGKELLKMLFDGRVNLPTVENSVRDCISDMNRRREADIFGSILWRDTSRSTEYFSRWIELKESLSAEKEDENKK